MSISNQPQRKRGRFFRFSLRTLLALFTLLAIGMGWYANRSLEQRRVAAAIVEKGGRIYYQYNDPTQGFSVPPKPEPFLADYLGIDFADTVVCADLLGNKFDDEDVTALKAFPKLQWLRLYETRATGKTFDTVSRLTDLKWLVVEKTPLDDEALTQIGKLQNLQCLYLVDTKITDRGVAQLAHLTRLKEVSLSGCQLSDSGISHLQGWTNVEWASFENTHVGDDGLETLRHWPLLRRLSLKGTHVSDAGVPTLTSLPVEWILLGSTLVTDSGLRTLRDAGPPKRYVSPDPDGNR
jgi:hypothetical protein